jgi:hypothetical protein
VSSGDLGFPKRESGRIPQHSTAKHSTALTAELEEEGGKGGIRKYSTIVPKSTIYNPPALRTSPPPAKQRVPSTSTVHEPNSDPRAWKELESSKQESLGSSQLMFTSGTV